MDVIPLVFFFHASRGVTRIFVFVDVVVAVVLLPLLLDILDHNR